MKKIIGILVLLFFSGSIYVLATSEFVAKNEPAEIEKELSKFLNRPTGNLKVKLLKIERIDESDTSIAVFSLNENQMGYAKLENRWFNKVKIIHAGHGSAYIKYRGMETNKGDYGVLYGVNPDLALHTIRINNPDVGHPQDIDVSKEEVILEVGKLTTDVQRAMASELVFFDKEGKDITRELYELP